MNYQVNDILKNRYKIVKYLGGKENVLVYLTSDLHYETRNKKRIYKIVKCFQNINLDNEEILQVQKEIKLLSRIKHPFILQVYDYFNCESTHFIVYEYCKCGDLSTFITKEKRCGKITPEEKVCRWMVQLVLALIHLHEMKIIHKNLKPSNIFIKDENVKLGDFSILQLENSTNPFMNETSSIPYYISPEMLKSEHYNNKTDVWSMGVIIYEICSQTHAFAGTNLIHVVWNIVEGPCPQLPDAYSADLQMLLTTMLNKDPMKRPSSIDLVKSPFLKQHMQMIMKRHLLLTCQDALGSEWQMPDFRKLWSTPSSATEQVYDSSDKRLLEEKEELPKETKENTVPTTGEMQMSRGWLVTEKYNLRKIPPMKGKKQRLLDQLKRSLASPEMDLQADRQLREIRQLLLNTQLSELSESDDEYLFKPFSIEKLSDKTEDGIESLYPEEMKLTPSLEEIKRLCRESQIGLQAPFANTNQDTDDQILHELYYGQMTFNNSPLQMISGSEKFYSSYKRNLMQSLALTRETLVKAEHTSSSDDEGSFSSDTESDLSEGEAALRELEYIRNALGLGKRASKQAPMTEPFIELRGRDARVTRIAKLRRTCIMKFGEDIFNKFHSYLTQKRTKEGNSTVELTLLKKWQDLHLDISDLKLMDEIVFLEHIERTEKNKLT